jgi:hypothetical protein
MLGGADTRIRCWPDGNQKPRSLVGGGTKEDQSPPLFGEAERPGMQTKRLFFVTMIACLSRLSLEHHPCRPHTAQKLSLTLNATPIDAGLRLI